MSICWLSWLAGEFGSSRLIQAVSTEEVVTENINLALPQLKSNVTIQAIPRYTKLHTIIPTRPREDVLDYTVVAGDSVFGLARSFGIKPESILWSNYDTLNDNPDQLSPGIKLKIPPVDGVLYQWKEGDNVLGVAEQFKTKPEAILGWSGNKLDLTDPEIEPGTFVMVPGGEREFRQWLVPTIPRGRAGVSFFMGPGHVQTGMKVHMGQALFASCNALSGNDYWSGHLG
jgi:LysM repeat protein